MHTWIAAINCGTTTHSTPLDAMMDETIGKLVAHLAQTNVELWHEEDKARVEDDHQVAAAKRRIDALNQQRNDLIERIDAEVLRVVRETPAPETTRG